MMLGTGARNTMLNAHTSPATGNCRLARLISQIRACWFSRVAFAGHELGSRNEENTNGSPIV